ncbi:PKD domain-containing protein, partial [[Eubacterium] cellulosolvens]
YSWDFGDEGGTIVLGRNVSHIYEAPGVYTIEVTVNDGNGGLAVDSMLVNITVPEVEQNDSDGDEYPDNIDAFPNNSTEWQDSDGDNIGDNADTDDDADGLDDEWELETFGNLSQNATSDFDNDGYTDLEEFEEGTNPKDKGDTPKDKKDDGKDDDGGGLGLPSGNDLFMYIIGIIAIVNLILIILVIAFLMTRKRPGAEPEPGEARAAWDQEGFTIPCPECGKPVNDRERECPYCGEELDLERAEDYEEDWDARGPRRREPAKGYGRHAREAEEEDWEEEYPEEEEPEPEWDEEEEEYYDEEEAPEEEWEDEEYDEDEEYEDEGEWEDDEEYYDEDEDYEDVDEGDWEEGEEYDDEEYEDDRYYEDNYKPSSAWGRHESKPAWDSGRGAKGYRRK